MKNLPPQSTYIYMCVAFVLFSFFSVSFVKADFKYCTWDSMQHLSIFYEKFLFSSLCLPHDLSSVFIFALDFRSNRIFSNIFVFVIVAVCSSSRTENVFPRALLLLLQKNHFSSVCSLFRQFHPNMDG